MDLKPLVSILQLQGNPAESYTLNPVREPFRLDRSSQLDQGLPLHETKGSVSADEKKEKLMKAAEGFEAIFIRKLLSTMRTTMSDNSMFGSGVSGEIYGDIMDSAVSDVMAGKHVLGFADMLYRSMAE